MTGAEQTERVNMPTLAEVEEGAVVRLPNAAWNETNDELILALDGYEGPLDVLLGLARSQKVDLAKISMLQLAEQYLAFVERARRQHLELAADYLVMAAWLAYMKSRLLLPEAPGGAEPSGEEMAAALAFRLRKLEAMREAAARLMAHSRLMMQVFPRGAPGGIEVVRQPVFEAALYDLLRSYADYKSRAARATAFRIEVSEHYSVEEAYRRLTQLLGAVPEWETLQRFLPHGAASGLQRRSGIATTLAASLELAKEGKIQIRQFEPFGPIYIRSASATP
jgi:segregation and condensation protein A